MTLKAGYIRLREKYLFVIRQFSKLTENEEQMYKVEIEDFKKVFWETKDKSNFIYRIHK